MTFDLEKYVWPMSQRARLSKWLPGQDSCWCLNWEMFQSGTMQSQKMHRKHFQQVILLNLFFSCICFAADVAAEHVAGAVEPHLALEIDVLICFAVQIRRWRGKSFV